MSSLSLSIYIYIGTQHICIGIMTSVDDSAVNYCVVQETCDANSF